MNWKDVETWEEAAKQVADLIEENKSLKKILTERTAKLVRAIRLLREEGINFEMEEVKAKAHASGELAELLNEKPRWLEEGERL